MFYRGHEFNETKAGESPTDWNVVSLGDVCNQRKEIVVPSGRGTRFVGLEHVSPGETELRHYALDYGVKSSKFKFHPSDILYGKLRPYLDKAARADFDGICSTDFIVLSVNKQNSIPEFLQYLLHSPRFISHAISTTSGTNHPRTSWGAISKFTFGLPSISEQRGISKVLSTVEKAINKNNEVIAKTERLKKGLIRELLTNGIRHNEFKESEIGRIPEEWKVVTLEQTAEKKKNSLQDGPFGSDLKVGDYTENGVRIIRLENIGDGFFSDTYRRYVSEEKTKELSRFVAYPGDIVISEMADPIARACILPNTEKEYVLTAKSVKLKVAGGFSPTFIMHAINSPKVRLQAIAKTAGSTRPMITLRALRNLKIPIPPPSEQQEIAKTLSTVDKKLDQERIERTHLGNLRIGLTDLLLSGKVRFKVN